MKDSNQNQEIYENKNTVIYIRGRQQQVCNSFFDLILGSTRRIVFVSGAGDDVGVCLIKLDF